MHFSLGLVEVSSLGHAIAMTDGMLKAADVEFVATERRLGGRLVTIVVRGELSAVRSSVDVGKQMAKNMGCFKAAEVIANPHPEIFKFLHLDPEQETVHHEKVTQITKSKKTTRSKTAQKAAVSDKKPSKQRVIK